MLSIDRIRDFPILFHARRARYKHRFMHEEAGSFWGVYDTIDEAKSKIKSALISDYSDENLVDFQADKFVKIHLFDWPVIFYLKKLIVEEKLLYLVDFGGHVGAKYIAYREILNFPDGFSWHVVDLAPMVAKGRRIFTEKSASHLSFSEDIPSGTRADILLCSGSLQFCPFTIIDVLNKFSCKPSNIVLNKMPYCKSGAFVTLENFEKVKVPYYIFDRDEHDGRLRGAGYDLVARWRLPYRDFDIPYAVPRRTIKMFGEVWSRNDKTTINSGKNRST
jgi:putative methyltransferase (TIGR04325 family)